MSSFDPNGVINVSYNIFCNVPYHGLEMKASRSNSWTVSTFKHLSAASTDIGVCVNNAKQAKKEMFCFMYMIFVERWIEGEMSIVL